jgi:hypothetical protein
MNVAQHVGAADATPFGTVGAEHAAQIAESGCAQQSVAERMRRDVPVGMPSAAVGVIE